MWALLSVWIGLLGAPAAPTAVVLGIAQDGGVPHAGCHQELCVAARRDPSLRKRVASLGLVDPEANRRFLVDATPDFADQMERLGGLPDGILLTHAHIGHYLGLAQLGREVLDAKKVPVYATARMARFLRENRPWSRLVAMGNIEIREIEPDREFALTPRLSATAIRVPHRDIDSDTDTVAFRIRGPGRTVLWLPDIDRWDRRLADLLADPETIAFVDGTFFSADEIPGRSLADIPHPLVPDTMNSLAAVSSERGRVFFVHLNHTNRLLWDVEANREIEAKGFGVAREGQTVSFSETMP